MKRSARSRLAARSVFPLLLLALALFLFPHGVNAQGDG